MRGPLTVHEHAKAAATGDRLNRNGAVWAVVKLIPDGRVATYGQIAVLAGLSGPTGARQVGYALAALGSDSEVPWHRVINAQGCISPRADPDVTLMQRSMLEDEGIEFGIAGKVALERYQWVPESVP